MVGGVGVEQGTKWAWSMREWADRVGPSTRMGGFVNVLEKIP